MRRRLAAEQGSALVTAILITMLFLSLGLSTVGFVDTQQRESGRERVRESSFALAEGVLNSQIYLLSRQWPGTIGQAYDTACTKLTGADPQCPDATTIEGTFDGVDYRDAAVEWSTEIHDNTDAAGTAKFYDDAVVRLQAGWDANRDGHVWVRAQAVLNPTSVHPHRRTVVALVNVEELTTMFPRNAVVAGKIKVHPNGNQTYLGTSGSYVTLRCTETTLDNENCRDWERLGHVGPNAEVVANPTQPPAMTVDAIERMRETAKANGTYFASGCVPSLTGAVVFIERADCASAYDLPGTQSWNTSVEPGALIIGSGSIGLRGNAIYYGVVYHVNGSDGVGPTSTDHVVQLDGNSCIVGSVIIDGGGGLKVGSSSGASRCPNRQGNLQFDANASNRLKAYGTAGIVQNSFREISVGN